MPRRTLLTSQRDIRGFVWLVGRLHPSKCVSAPEYLKWLSGLLQPCANRSAHHGRLISQCTDCHHCKQVYLNKMSGRLPRITPNCPLCLPRSSSISGWKGAGGLVADPMRAGYGSDLACRQPVCNYTKLDMSLHVLAFALTQLCMNEVFKYILLAGVCGAIPPGLCVDGIKKDSAALQQPRELVSLDVSNLQLNLTSFSTPCQGPPRRT